MSLVVGNGIIIGLCPRIRKKIKTCKISDWQSYREYKEHEYVDTEWIKRQLKSCMYNCKLCKISLKLVEWKPDDNSQFSIDRLNNRIAHIKSNCQVICLGCNRKKELK